MITVTISIDGKKVFTRSAKKAGRVQGDMVKYITNGKKIIYHFPGEGNVQLARKILWTALQ